MNKLLPGHRVLSVSMISGIFLLVVLVMLWSINRYWSGVLQPRLQMAAETHAQVLSDAQGASLVNVLEHAATDRLARAVTGKLQELLLITDPAIREPMFRGISLELDYDLVRAPAGALDLAMGSTQCERCYRFEVPLASQDGSWLGVATFHVTDAYYRRLSGDMKSKLFAELSVALVMIGLVWVAALMLYFRLQRARELIEKSDRAKTRFMANVSHELRTPLNAILGYTQLYKRKPELMEQLGQGINTIDRSAEHLLLMINDILDFSRADSDQVQLQDREVMLKDFLSSLVEMTQVRAHLKDITFEHHFVENLPAVVLADDKRLRQVLLNLLYNAVKFTREGSVQFNVSAGTARKSLRDQVVLRFEILDTGPGIPADKLEEIFVPFHQLEQDDAAAEGSGLGLAISKSLVELMGSRLRVESTQGKGSRFWFDLRLQTLGGESVETGPARIEGYSGRRREILAVDDNDLNRDVLRQRLESYGFEVIEASSGEQALSIIQGRRVDLVLLDVLMPGMDGFATLAALRALPAAQGVPVIALTASAQPETHARARQAGFDDLLIKPVPDPALLGALQTVLGLEWELAAAPVPSVAEPSEARVPPSREVLEQLRALAAEHNVLGLRDRLAQLEKQPEHRAFVAALQPMVRGYRFRQLEGYLDDLVTGK